MQPSIPSSLPRFDRRPDRRPTVRAIGGRSVDPVRAFRRLSRSRRRSEVAGFTLIEIMLVVGIITVLMGAAIYYLSGNLDIAKEQRVRADIQAISMQLKTYETLNLFLPSNEQGLKALVERPTSQPVPERWKQMLEKEPIDPWGHGYAYRNPGRKNSKGFDLFSVGADGQEGTEDDIGNWQN